MTIKKCLLLLLALVALVGFMGCTTTSEVPDAAPAAPKTTVIVHYNRPSADYDGWNLWMWANGLDGQYDFTEEDSFGKVAVVTSKKVNNEVGFVLRSTSNWDTATKDTEDDRFIAVTDGIGEVWIYQDDPTVYTVAPSAE